VTKRCFVSFAPDLTWSHRLFHRKTMDNQPPISDGDVSIKFPINLMILFINIHVHHSLVTTDCCLSSCLVSPLSPNCNIRQASHYRIETLHFDPTLSSSTVAYPLVCYLSETNDEKFPSAPAFSMFNYEDDIKDRYFRFNLFSDCGGGSEHALFHVYLLSETDVKVINDINVTSKLYNEYKSFLVGKSSVAAVQSIIQKFSKRYNGFLSSESFLLLDSHILHLYSLVGSNETPRCVSQSNEFFQIVYRFQLFVSLRVGFIEGAHRHLCYFRRIYNMNLQTVGEDVVTANTYFVRLEQQVPVGDIPFPLLCNDLLLKYNTYVDIHSDPSDPTSDQPASDPDSILLFARQESKQSMVTAQNSVCNEDTPE
jgi:hypothetical protein